MARTYFGTSSSGNDNLLPFFNEWYEKLTKEEKDFYEGKAFLVEKLKFAKTSKKGYIVSCYHFVTFMFRSHPFLKALAESKNYKALEGQSLCIEINSKEQWGYTFCLEAWPVKYSGTLEDLIEIKGDSSTYLERGIIGYSLPSIVPSITPVPSSKPSEESITEIMKREGHGGQEGTKRVKKVG